MRVMFQHFRVWLATKTVRLTIWLLPTDYLKDRHLFALQLYDDISKRRLDGLMMYTESKEYVFENE